MPEERKSIDSVKGRKNKDSRSSLAPGVSRIRTSRRYVLIRTGSNKSDRTVGLPGPQWHEDRIATYLRRLRTAAPIPASPDPSKINDAGSGIA